MQKSFIGQCALRSKSRIIKLSDKRSTRLRTSESLVNWRAHRNAFESPVEIKLAHVQTNVDSQRNKKENCDRYF